MISPPCVRWNERTCERFRFYVRGSFLRFFSMTDECGPNIHGLSRTLLSLRNEVDKHALKESQEFVSSFFPYLKRYPATNAWSGLMPFSMDGKPILNSFAKYGHSNLFIAGGFGGEGIMYGPGCSKIFAAWMLGKENVIKDQPVVFETFKHVWGALS